MAKKIVCDICGKVIEKEGLWERYSLWMRDPNGENRVFPKRMDICYDCLEEIKVLVNNKNASKEIEKLASGALSENIDDSLPMAFIDDELCEECMLEKPKKKSKKKKVE